MKAEIGHITTRKDLYQEIKISDNEWMLYSRYLMEKHLGRKLKREELIHHEDEDVSNNSLENLRIVTKSEHFKLHQAGEKHPMFGKHHSDETKRKMSIIKKKYWSQKRKKDEINGRT